MADDNYWAMGITGLVSVAGSGLLGHKIQNLVAPNPPTAISRPASAPTTAPVQGQQGYANAPAQQSYFATHWKMYAIGAAVVVGLVVTVAALRRK